MVDMANTKISDLPAATTVSSTDLVPVVQGGITKKATVALFGGFGDNAITVGVGGDFTTIEDAIAHRATMSQTLITSFTGSCVSTSGGTVKSYIITADAGASPMTSYKNLKGIGVRIGGSGPIVRAKIVRNTGVVLLYPTPVDITSQLIEVYEITTVAIVLLPGTRLSLNTTGLHIPAFTTICAATPHSASIVKTGGTAGLGTLFTDEASQNEITFSGLIFEDTQSTANSRLINFPNATTHAFQVLCDYFVDNCRFYVDTMDAIYSGHDLGGITGYTSGFGAGYHITNNTFDGRFDVIYLEQGRLARICNNTFNMVSSNAGLDSGVPAGMILVKGSDDVYPDVSVVIKDNNIYCDLTDVSVSAGAEYSLYGINIAGMYENVWAIISDNIIHLNNTYTLSASSVVIGLNVSLSAPAPANYNIIFKDNVIRAKTLPTGSAVLATSDGATIHRAGNAVFGGGVTAYGTNTAALTTY